MKSQILFSIFSIGFAAKNSITRTSNINARSIASNSRTLVTKDNYGIGGKKEYSEGILRATQNRRLRGPDRPDNDNGGNRPDDNDRPNGSGDRPDDNGGNRPDDSNDRPDDNDNDGDGQPNNEVLQEILSTAAQSFVSFDWSATSEKLREAFVLLVDFVQSDWFQGFVDDASEFFAGAADAATDAATDAIAAGGDGARRLRGPDRPDNDNDRPDHDGGNRPDDNDRPNGSGDRPDNDNGGNRPDDSNDRPDDNDNDGDGQPNNEVLQEILSTAAQSFVSFDWSATSEKLREAFVLLVDFVQSDWFQGFVDDASEFFAGAADAATDAATDAIAAGGDGARRLRGPDRPDNNDRPDHDGGNRPDDNDRPNGSGDGPDDNDNGGNRPDDSNDRPDDNDNGGNRPDDSNDRPDDNDNDGDGQSNNNEVLQEILSTAAQSFASFDWSATIEKLREAFVLLVDIVQSDAFQGFVDDASEFFAGATNATNAIAAGGGNGA